MTDDTVFVDDMMMPSTSKELRKESSSQSSDLDMRKEDYYKASIMFYQKQNHSGRESILMSPVSFLLNQNDPNPCPVVNSKFNLTSNDTQDWNNIGLPVPDEQSLAKTASRRSLRKSNQMTLGIPSVNNANVNQSQSQDNDNSDTSLNSDIIKMKKREDGDGHVGDYSVKTLLKKFSSGDLENQTSQETSNKINDELKHFKQNSFLEISKKFQMTINNNNVQENLSPNICLNPDPNNNKSCVSDSEILDNDSTVDDDTIKSAPIVLSPLSSVLADLRKTADIKKEKSYQQKQDEQLSSPTLKVDEVIVTKGALQLNFNEEIIDKQLSNNEGNNNEEETEENDADDELSRDFDSLNYHHTNLQSSSSSHGNEIKLKPGCRVRTYKKPRPEPVPVIPNISMTFQRTSLVQQQPELSPAQQQTNINHQLLNPNPAYESFDGIRNGNISNEANHAKGTLLTSPSTLLTSPSTVLAAPTTALAAPTSPTGLTDSNTSQNVSDSSPDNKRSPSSAPYYYSDLLSEEQQLALQERLAACQSGSPPPLLSRCNALNNTRFLGVTSLQKGDIGKRVNKIGTTLNNSQQQNNQSIKTVLNNTHQLLDASSKFLDAERNKYEAGHTLQKVSDWKRCVTPDLSQSFEKSRFSFLDQDNGQNTIAKRRSRSLEGLLDAVNNEYVDGNHSRDHHNSGHIYENLGKFAIELNCDNENGNGNSGIDDGTNQKGINENEKNLVDDNGDDDYLDCELLRKASAKHFNETKVINKSSTKLLTNVISNNNNHDQQTNNSVVPLVERLEKSFDAEGQSDKEFSDSSSLSSMIELGESCVDNQ